MSRSVPFSWLLFVLTTGLIAFPQEPASTVVPVQVSMPRLVRFTGVLKDESGNARSGTVGLTFTLHKDQQTNAALWTESQNVKLDETGHYTVLLGLTQAEGLPVELFLSGEARWLGVEAEGQKQQPRVLLVSVPYALRAAEADTLAGHAASEFVTADKLSSAVQQELGSGFNRNSTALTKKNGVKSPNAPTDPATNFVDNTTNQVVGITQNGSGMGLFATSTTGTAIRGNSTGTAIFGLSTGAGATALQGSTSSTTGKGIYGYATATSGINYGVLGSTASPDGIGMYGYNNATSGTPIGILGATLSTTGTAIKGQANAASGTNIGVLGTSASPSGVAGAFQNTGGGLALATRNMSGVNVMWVDSVGNLNAQGTVTATSSSAYGGLFTGGNSTTGSSGVLGRGGNASDAGRSGALGVQGIGGNGNGAGGYGGTGVGGFGAGTAVNASTGGSGVSGLGGNATGTASFGGSGGNFEGGSGTSLGGPGIFAVGGLSSGPNQGTGIEAQGASNSSITSKGGVGVLGTGGTGHANTGGVGVEGQGAGVSSPTAGLAAGAGLVGLGGANTVSDGVGGAGAELHAGNGDASGNGQGGDGVTAYAGSGATNGMAARFYANSTTQMVIGVTGCGTNNSGFGFLGTMTGCNNYTLNYNPNNSNLSLNRPTGGALNVRENQTLQFIVDTGGNVGIAVGTPSNIFTIGQGAGNALADGWHTYSSARWKNNIHTLHGSLARVLQLRGVSYNYLPSGSHDIGMIAEEVGKVVPEVVTYEENGKEAQSIDYSRLTAVLIEAVKEQQKEIQEQRAQLRRLEAQVLKLSNAH